MKRLLFFCLWICAVCLRAAVPTFESFSTEQFQTNNLRVFYRAVFTNDVGIIHADQTNSLMLITNLNAYGTFSLPSKVQLLTLGTNYLDMSTNTTWLLNSPTNDAAQVIISLSAGAYQGQLALITSQNGANAFTLPNQSEQWDVPGAVVWLSGSDWIGTTNRGILLQYTAPDWVSIERFDPSGGGGGSALWYILNGALTPSPAVNVVSNTVFAATTTFWTTNLGNATNPSVAIDGTLANPGAGIYRAANGALAIASTAVNVATFNTDSVRFGDAMPLLWSAGSPDTVAARFGFYHGSGSPEGVVTANVGSLYNDYTGGDIYRKGSGVGNVGWLVLSTGGGGGTTINPTDGFVPYRANGTTFGDSALTNVSSVSVGLGSGTNLFTRTGNEKVTYTSGATSPVFEISDGGGNTTQVGVGSGVGFVSSGANLQLSGFSDVVNLGGQAFQYSSNNAVQFKVSANSGYTGAGTLFLSDDGTYKAGGGGGGAPVGTMVESGISTAGVIPMSAGTSGTNYVASPAQGTGTNVAFNGGITANKGTFTNDLSVPSGNITVSGSVTSGSGSGVAGILDLAQGTLPSLGITSVSLLAPTSVTSYGLKFPGSANVNAGVLQWGAPSAGISTGTFLDVDTDGTLAANSDTRLATQKATKTYADTKAGAGANANITSATGLTGPLAGTQRVDPMICYLKSATLLTSGTPADIGTIPIPTGVSRYKVFTGSSGATWSSGMYSETAAGTLASATFTIRDASGGGGNIVISSTSGPATANVFVGMAAQDAVGVYTSSTLSVRQNANSGNAGTMSFYVMVIPLP